MTVAVIVLAATLAGSVGAIAALVVWLRQSLTAERAQGLATLEQERSMLEAQAARDAAIVKATAAQAAADKAIAQLAPTQARLNAAEATLKDRIEASMIGATDEAVLAELNRQLGAPLIGGS